MSATIDANILVYARNEDAEEFEIARSLVERLGAGPDLIYLFWPTIMGFLRIVTHAGILARPLTPAGAEESVTRLLGRPHVQTPSETAAFWELYRSTAGGPRGNDVPDAHLASLMRAHGVATIYTRDRDFRRYDGIEVRDPFAPRSS